MSKRLRVKTGIRAGKMTGNHNQTRREPPGMPEERGSLTGLRDNARSRAVHYSGLWPTKEGFMSKHLRVKTSIKAGGVDFKNHNQNLIRTR